MAFDLVSAYVTTSDSPFFVSGQAAQTLTEAPQQMTLRFSPGVTIDSGTLGSISVTRSGLAGTITPGSIVVNDVPNQNEVVIRFADTLPDDTYQITVNGGAGGLRTQPGDTMVSSRTINVRLDLGAFVTSVVPQPVVRSGGALVQNRDQVTVYFNVEDPLSAASAQSVGSYRLFEVDRTTGADVAPLAPLNPTGVAYDATTGRAVLTFAAGAIADNRLYRLQIGSAEALVGPAASRTEGTDFSDVNSSFITAFNLGNLTSGGVSVFGAINVSTGVLTPASATRLAFPTQPGSIDEPGHRDLPDDIGNDHGSLNQGSAASNATSTVAYNFRSDYGVDPQGNPLFNMITEAQKQRAREIFEIYSRYTGLRFVETDNLGITVVTGDFRAIDPGISTAPSGLAGNGLAIMDSTDNWGDSEYGGAWFRVAMHEIGHVLGLPHSYDIASIMGGGLTGEAVFPGDYDTIHLAQLFPAIGADIDVYRFALPTAGRLSAETVVARPGQVATSRLDSLLTLYREDPATGQRMLVARNDDYYGRDSFVGLDLAAGTYYVAVSSTGNDKFNPEVSDSGSGGRSDGAYQLRLGFQPVSTSSTTIVDATGTLLDGDRDGKAGGAFNFWFNTATSTSNPTTNKTLFVDKASTVAGTGDGTLARPFKRVDQALAAATPGSIVRIVGNATNAPYLIGTRLTGQPLDDGATFNVPAGVTVMIDEGAVFKLRAAIIDVGSSSPIVSRAGAALQVLGTPTGKVTFTSYHDDSIGGNSDGVGPAAAGGQWGGIVLRSDSDFAATAGGAKTAFVNSISQAAVSYGGGQVFVDSQLDSFTPVQLENARPTLAFNTITSSAGAAMSATPNSFEDANGRIGPEIRGNRLTGNSINGLFVKIRTPLGGEPERLDVAARFRSTDVVYVLQDNLFIAGGVGGYEFDGTNVLARRSGRLAIDPGVVVKLQGARIELEWGTSQLIAEGTAGQRVVFTSLGDNRFGAGGTFDTNGNLPDVRAAGDWGGIVLDACAKASIDYAYIAHGGGQTPIEGTLDRFNVIETHQGDLRLAHSRIENNANGLASTDRTARGTNAAATVFVRGAQPVILGNDFRDNLGAVVSVNANALSDVSRPDPGRSTGAIDRDERFDDNRGLLVRDNRLSYTTGTGRAAGGGTLGMQVRGEEITVESVWDDTDIVHVLQNEIIVNNFHTATGVRLVSQPRGSLVVKLSGASAGFTASGYGLDITDRIGGTVQVVGQPGYPVVLTSLKDDSVGAGVDPIGQLVKDTNTDASASTPVAGDWRSLRFLPFSNDRNVAIVQETEQPAGGWLESNSMPATAQVLGVLAPNYAVANTFGTMNSWESAQEKGGDDARRLGFEVHGAVSYASPRDVDVYSFTGYAGSEVWIDVDKTSSGLDSMVELLDASGTVLARSVDAHDGDLAGATTLGALSLEKDAWRGGDFYSVNPRDPGMRVILPGAIGSQNQYFIRVTSQPRFEPVTVNNGTAVTATTKAAYEADLGRDPNSSLTPRIGATSGDYELRVRLQQRDEKPGSTVRYADIRFPTIGIDVQGLPRNSLLTAETGETTAANDTLATAQAVGNVLQTDHNTIGIAGAISSATDVDWYTFALNIEQIQSIAGVNDGTKSWSTVFDLDYGDGVRGDFSIYVFDSNGRLIFTGRDSDVAADQPGVGQGNDVDDLSRGGIGKLDPFIGSVQMPAGGPAGGVVANQTRYYVAVTSSRNLPTALNATFVDAATNSLIRLEPISSVERIVEDRIGSVGGTIPQAPPAIIDIATAAVLSTHVTPFTLSDVALFVSTGGSLITVDAMRGGVETTVSTTNGTNDIVMRSDGRLYGYRGLVNTANTAGTLDLIDTGTGARTNVGNDDIPDAPATTAVTENNVPTNTNGPAVSTTTFRLANPNVIPATMTGTLSWSGNVGPVPLSGSWTFTTNAAGAMTFVANAANPVGIPNPQSIVSDVTAASGVVTILWDQPFTASSTAPANPVLAQVRYQFTPDPQAVTTSNVDALAWRRTNVGAYDDLYYSVRENTASRLYRANPANGSAAVPTPNTTVYGRKGNYIQDAGNSLGIVTGMAFVGGTLYGVDTNGYLFSINPNTAVATLIDIDPAVDLDGNPLTPDNLAGVSFAGLTIGPQNLYGGTLRNALFAISNTGVLYAFDTAGNRLQVFDQNADGTADATSIATGAGGATGLAFSPLDVNLWHPTTRRFADAGHGINAAPDNSRVGVNGGTSMYFGLEQYVAGTTPYLNYQSPNGQYGVLTSQWQEDLSTNAAIPNTYNLPGGAYGSLTTNAFDLSVYSYTDKPTLYFNYLLQTQGAASKTNGMRDSARVFVSIDGGATWDVIATNNSSKSTLDQPPDAELPAFASVSSRISVNDNQHVQELFDSASWRQARVDLGRYAGEADIRLRFDFSTAGEFDAAQRNAAGALVNQINGLAGTTGNFNSAERGQNNQFEGFYIDDIIVGFAERGEMVTGAAANQTAFVDLATLGTPTSGTGTVPAQVLTGAYQLDIRRGTTYAQTGGAGDITITQTFDTNDDLVPSNPVQPVVPAAGNPYAAGWLGDANTPRQQGQFLIQNNIISSAATYGISIDAAARDPISNAPLPGVLRNVPVTNSSRLVPGVVVSNNVVSTSGTAGIRFSGDPNTGTVPTAAVPFGRIVNNTIYGGPAPAGVGVEVGENAGPTLLNNVFSNLATGVSVDASSRVDGASNQRTVITASAFHAVGTQVSAGVTQSQAIVLPATSPFVNAATRNFYPIAGSPIVDSAINALADRAENVAVTGPLGLPQSPMLAPDRDLFGQLRGDDPAQASAPGLGSNVFKDRGAIDRVDFFQPYAMLARPLDQDPTIDLDTTADAVVLKVGARTQTAFELQLDDSGAGIDKTTVTSAAFTLTRNGVPLVLNTDYVFRYLETTNRVVFESAGVFPLGRYVISVTQQTVGGVVRNVVADLAGNALLANKSDGTTSFSIALADVPTAPGKPVGTPANGQVVLTWAAPASDGDSPITDYTVEYKVNGQPDSAYVTFNDGVQPTTGATVTGLVNGTAYVFRVRAVNALGSSDPSLPSDPVIPGIVPGTPTNLVVTSVASGQVALGWSAPGVLGSPALNDYVVEWSSDSGTTWTVFNDGVGTTTAATVTGLTNGVAYLLRVKARSAIGDGGYVQVASGPVVPGVLPGAPTGLAGVPTAFTRSVSLTWNAPVAAGSPALTDYAVEYKVNGQPDSAYVTFNDGVQSATGATVTGLTSATTYVFRVKAVNAVGTGAASATITVALSATVPSAPQNLTVASVANGSATLGWTAPADNGGAAITDYVVQYKVTGQADSAYRTFADGVRATTGAVVTGLTNGTSYTFRVAAGNVRGVGPYAATATATPWPQAAAPTRLTGTAGNGFVSLVWTAPKVAAGTVILDYVVQYRAYTAGVPGAWTAIADGVSSLPKATLAMANGVTYDFRVAALTSGNIVGLFSAASPRLTPFLPGAVPTAPTNVTGVRLASGTVGLSWIAPPATAGGEVTGYVVQYAPAGSTTWATLNVTGTTATISRLIAGRGYSFRIAARNLAGIGAYSSLVSVTA